MPRAADARINITAQDKTKQAFTSVNKRLGVLSTGFKAFGAAAAGILAGRFVTSIKTAAQQLGAIADTADKLGLTTDALQELRFAAEQAGVKVNSFDIGFQRFTRRAADAAAGNKALAKTFKDMGISLVTSGGTLKSNEELFLQFADAIKNTDDQGKRILKTFQLFDTEGVDLVRLLQQGSGAIDDFRDRARSMGAVVDESLIRKSREADNQLAALSRVISANLKPALAELAPLLVQAASGLAGFAQNVAFFFRAIGLSSSTDPLTQFTDKIREIEKKLAGARARRESFVSGLLGTRQELDTEIAGYVNSLKVLQIAVDNLKGKKKDFTGGGGLPPVLTPDEKTVKTFDEITTELRLQNREIDSQLRGYSTAFKTTQAILAAMKELKRTLKPEEASVIEQLTKDGIRLNEELAESKKKTDEMSDGAKDLGYAFSSAFEDAILAGNNLREVFQGLLKDILKIALRETITKPLGNAVASFATSFFADGTSFAPGGLAVVGERGPELVNLPRGSQVIPNNKIGGGGITLNVDARGSTDPSATERAVRRAVDSSISTMRSMKTRGMLPEFA